MKIWNSLLLCSLLLGGIGGQAVAQQKFKFAEVSDTHVGGDNALEDLQRTVADINQQPDLAFVIISGDITEFGSDAELQLAKSILDKLNKPWYIIPGNHDTKWSESGGNTFRKVFGDETFSFSHGGYQFLGTNCGPNMRMGPGQVPRENIVWLNKQLATLDTVTPVIYINHYPQNADLNNWFEAIDPLKKHNIQLILCGHGHANRVFDFEQIPGVMCRSNLRAKDSIGGYNIVTIADGKASFEERTPLIGKNRPWAAVPLLSHRAVAGQPAFPRPSYAMNDSFPNVKRRWSYQDHSDIGSGMALSKDLVISTNTAGEIYAMQLQTGKRKWNFPTEGKIYATPAVYNDRVVVASSDHHIYCLQASTGKFLWKFATDKPLVASTQIVNNIAYVGSSDGHFRAIDLVSGKLKWEFTDVNGFVEDKPLYYQGKIYFGSWGNDFYALDAATGALQWKWNNGASNRMFSPAACWPVAADNKVFIVAPDRYMTAFDAATGKVIWRKSLKEHKVRESLGLSIDSSTVFVKTMEGHLLGIAAKADTMQVLWQSNAEMDYELDPAAPVEYKGVIYVPTHSGVVYAVDAKTHMVRWKHKISNCLVNAVLPVADGKILASTMDGKLVCLDVK
ncbi:MAG: PQQ-binding-like beta-propeller repeat protein [Chitinophaga sp.]|uniref:outer membrane protein assembly factor BamB family protein n=1 Tax=Chitinophaga sp. TaxID=1869181 RepID=UPI0025C18865|nr:PQQ-binding-like beta-propeller repeat protein [Chitinophaga sp.]MBV8253571.1 PQQ-binding-like beta-propeller repeat protein [Chitinophaga sp.]